MKKINNSLKISCATTENFNLIYDGLENYFIFYDNEKVDQINDITNPKELLKIVNQKSFKDIEETEENPTIKKLISTISLKYEKSHQILRLLKTILNDLNYVIDDEVLYIQHYEKANPKIKQFIKELNSDYGYDDTLIDTDTNLGNDKDFIKIFNSYDNCIKMFDSELYDYVDNSKNVFMVVIFCICALFGYGSRFIVVNGGSEVGKSELIQVIKKLLPFFINLGSSTPASVRRKEQDEYNKKIVYLGDKGLKGTDNEEFKGLQEVFGGLITEKEFIRDIVIGDSVLEFNLKSDGVCVFYTEPYTNLRVFGAGDQYSTRSTFITVNPVKDGLSVFLQDENETNKFYDIHKDYIKYILNNPMELVISDEVKTEIWQASNDSLRTAKYLLALFKAFCQYKRIGNPLVIDVTDFLDVFAPKYDVTEIEFLVYERLYNNLNVLNKNDVEKKLYDDGSIKNSDMLRQRKERNKKSFFTAKQIKTYFANEFKKNKNLKDTKDKIPDILNNLFEAGLLNRIEWQYNNQNVYYILYNREMEK